MPFVTKEPHKLSSQVGLYIERDKSHVCYVDTIEDAQQLIDVLQEAISSGSLLTKEEITRYRSNPIWDTKIQIMERKNQNSV